MSHDMRTGVSLLDDSKADQKVYDHYKQAAVPWHEDMKFDKGQLVLESGSFQAWADEYVQFLLGRNLKRVAHDAYKRVKKVGIPVGDDKVLYNRCVPFGGMHQRWIGPCLVGKPRWDKTWLPMSRAGKSIGNVTFDNDVYIPILAMNDRLQPWMSLTPGEVFSQRSGIRKANGRVLMAGAGMGWLARKVLQRPQVKHLTLIEIDKAVVQLIKPAFEREFKDKVTFVNADVWVRLGIEGSVRETKHGTFRGSSGPTKEINDYDSILFDIWEGAGDASWDHKFEILLKARPDAWGWGYSVTHRY